MSSGFRNDCQDPGQQMYSNQCGLINTKTDSPGEEMGQRFRLKENAAQRQLIKITSDE